MSIAAPLSALPEWPQAGYAYDDIADTHFLSRDPLTSKTGEPYGYTRGDTLNSVDPLGFDNYEADSANNGFGNTFAGYTNGDSVLNQANQ